MPNRECAHAGDEDQLQQHVSRRAEQKRRARQPRPLAQCIEAEQHDARRLPGKAARRRKAHPLIGEMGQRNGGAGEKQERAGVHARLLAGRGTDVD